MSVASTCQSDQPLLKDWQKEHHLGEIIHTAMHIYPNPKLEATVLSIHLYIYLIDNYFESKFLSSICDIDCFSVVRIVAARGL